MDKMVRPHERYGFGQLGPVMDNALSMNKLVWRDAHDPIIDIKNEDEFSKRILRKNCYFLYLSVAQII